MQKGTKKTTADNSPFCNFVSSGGVFQRYKIQKAVVGVQTKIACHVWPVSLCSRVLAKPEHYGLYLKILYGKQLCCYFRSKVKGLV